MLNPVDILVIESAVILALLVLAAQTYRRNRRNPLFLFYSYMIIALALGLGLGSLNRWTAGLGSSSPALARGAETLYLLAVALLPLFSALFPLGFPRGRLSRDVPGKGSPALLKTIAALPPSIRWSLAVPAALMGLGFVDYPGLLPGLLGPDLASYFQRQPLTEPERYLLNRLFWAVCMGIALYLQYRKLRDEKDNGIPFYSRYFIGGGLGALAIALLLNMLGSIQAFAPYRDPAFYILILGLAFFMHRILFHRAVGLGNKPLHRALVHFGWTLLVIPLAAFLGYMTDAFFHVSPLLFSSILLLGLFGYLRLFHGFDSSLGRTFFRARYLRDQAINEYNEILLSLEAKDINDIQGRFCEFLDEFYRPGFLAFYSLGAGEAEQERKTESPRTSERLGAKLDNRSLHPPDAFPGEIARLLEKIEGPALDGGSIPALQAWADRLGDASASIALSRLAARGAELIIPFYEKNGDASRPVPRGAALIGQIRSGRPLDDGDWSFILSLRTPTLLAMSNHRLRKETQERARKLEAESDFLTSRLSRTLPEVRLGGAVTVFVHEPGGIMAEFMEQLEKFASRENPLLITGEKGVGKEQIVRFLYAEAGMNGRLIFAEHDPANPDGETERLFGRAGSEEEGLIAQAENGALCVKHVDLFPPGIQERFLRLLRDREYEKADSKVSLRSSARLIFLCGPNLEQAMEEERIGSEFYYGLRALEIRVPPLRERRADIPYLVEHFLMLAGRTFERPGLRMTPEAQELLMRHAWPGNVRELENIVLRTVVLSRGDKLDVADLPVLFKERLDFHRKQEQLEKVIEEQARLEKELLLDALEQSGGNQRQAAKILNISRGSLQYRMKQYGLAG